MNARFSTTGCVIFVLAGCLLVSCSSERARRNAEAERVDRQAGKLFADYLEGDVAQARKCLEETIDVYHGAHIYNPSGPICVEYLRLYLLEKRAGNQAGAQVALIKARYYELRSAEEEGMSDAEAIAGIKRLPDAKIEDFIDRLDKAASGGRKPKYLEDIGHS